MVNRNRVFQILREENERPEGWWYLSWADDAGFRGAAIVRGRGVITAKLTALSFGIDPQGELLACPHIDDPLLLPQPHFRNRLLTAAEVDCAYASSGGAFYINGRPLS